MHSRIQPLVALGALSLLLSSCSAPPPGEPSSHDPSGSGHGAVSGAEEVAEPPLGLTSIDRDGAVRHLDLLDESLTEIGSTAPADAMTTDGRYLFADTDDGVEIVDSGVWTWDHVDHFHYYRAAPAILGTVAGEGPSTVATTNSSTTGGTGISFAGSGDAVLLDTEALSKGRIHELFRIEREPHDGLVVPIGSFALVTRADAAAGTSVVGYTAAGEPVGLEEPCAEPSGTITTRVGAVIGCADGALLARVEGSGLLVERIPYPASASTDDAVGAISAFDNREGRPVVAGIAGDSVIRLLDTRKREWKTLTAPVPIVHVTAVDDEAGHVLALAEDGRVLVLSASDGSVLAETEPLAAASFEAGVRPTLIADQYRAYLAAPVERRIFEIDFADGARISRTFETATEPLFVAETGR